MEPRSKTDLDHGPKIKVKKRNSLASNIQSRVQSQITRKNRKSASSQDLNITEDNIAEENNSEKNSTQYTVPLINSQFSPTKSPRSPKRNYVGFKPSEIRTKTDLLHNRFITENLPVSEKSKPVLQTLTSMLKKVPLDQYESSDSSTKLVILEKLIQIFNFSWNETILQVKELSEEHAVVLSKLKSFYNNLFTEYPLLLHSYEEEIQDKNFQINIRDKKIDALAHQIYENNESHTSIRNYIKGLQAELQSVKEKRDYFETELNKQVLENEDMQTKLTDYFCILNKQKESIVRLYNIHEVFQSENGNQNANEDMIEGNLKNDLHLDEEIDSKSNELIRSKTDTHLTIVTPNNVSMANQSKKLEKAKLKLEFNRIVNESLKVSDEIKRKMKKEEGLITSSSSSLIDEFNLNKYESKSTQTIQSLDQPFSFIQNDFFSHQIQANSSVSSIKSELINRQNSVIFEKSPHHENNDNQSNDLMMMDSDDIYQLPDIQKEEKVEHNKGHSSLRQLIFTFMKSPCEYRPSKLHPDQNADLKKYFWVYPKCLMIFINGPKIENSNQIYSFDDIIISYFNQSYQTEYLSSQMLQSMVNSVVVYEQIDPFIHLFHSFLINEHDLNEFRFVNVLLEYSISLTEPLISTLVENDSLLPKDTIVHIKKKRAREIFTILFPIGEIPNWLSESSAGTDIDYWEFIEQCLEEFDKYRKHFWMILKNGLLLCQCMDNDHITYANYKNLFGITLPNMSMSEIKHSWKELITKNQATGKRVDVLDFESLCYYITSKERIFFDVMNRVTLKNFSARYFELDAHLLTVIAFIIKRLVYYIPTVSQYLTSNLAMFNRTGEAIRESLFMCDISGAFAHYRMLLHLIDGVFVRDCANLVLSTNSTEDEVNKFLDHFKLREEVVGIITLSSNNQSTK